LLSLRSCPAVAPTDALPNLLSARRWAIAAALVAVVFALHAVVPWLLEKGHPLPSPVQLGFGLVELPVALFVLCMVYRWSIQRGSGWPLTVVSSLLVSIAVAASTTAVMLLVLSRAGASSMHLLALGRLTGAELVVLVGSVLGIMQCGVWALAFVYPFTADESRIRALEADKLRTGAELARLRSQLEPHFLLNTLNAIAGLVTEDPREARRLLGCLGDLLRDALQSADELQTVDREVAWLRRYAAILEARYAGTLRFQWEIGEGVDNALIPRLLLQPLVENAVKHGALWRDSDGLVLIRIVRSGRAPRTRLLCAIVDNGPGTNPARSEGFGLAAVRRRLELKYGRDGAFLSLRSSRDGTEAVVELPLDAEPSRRGLRTEAVEREEDLS
jgi:hypothetical protein